MSYHITQLKEYPVVLLELDGDIDSEAIQPMLIECTSLFQETARLAALVIDIPDTAKIDPKPLANSLRIFQRTSLTFKRDGPIWIVFLGNVNIYNEVAAILASHRLHAPYFSRLSDALTYLDLKVGGSYIGQTLKRGATGELDTLQIPQGFPQPEPAEPPQQNELFPTSGVLRIEHLETGRSFVVIPRGELLIGRRSQDTPKPAIDLSMWGAFNMGVSRRHAQIYLESHRLKLVDLGSTNGTFVNSVRIAPHKPVGVVDGSLLTFGALAVRLQFEDTETS